MAVIAVHLSGDFYQETTEQLEKAYHDTKQHFFVSERFYLVRDDTLPQEVAEKVGIGYNNDPSNTVIWGPCSSSMHRIMGSTAVRYRNGQSKRNAHQLSKSSLTHRTAVWPPS